MSRLITLHEFIVTNQSHFPYATGELSRLLNDIVLASKVVSNDVRKAGLVEHILGAQGGQNVQGEEQQNSMLWPMKLSFVPFLTAEKFVELDPKKTMIF